MTPDVYIYEVELPKNVKEMVTPCPGGYTVYLNKKLCPAKKENALKHALKHIKGNDFEKHEVQRIEKDVHEDLCR